jgi:hypothetical protein
MEPQENNNISKPLIYLDQNIYDKIRREPLENLKDELKNAFTIVYSDENLKEIDGNKLENLKEEYIRILESFEPIYMKVVLNDKFRITDGVSFYKGPVRDFLKELRSNLSDLPHMSESMIKLANKFAGGQKGIKFDEIINEQKQDFTKLMTSIKVNMTPETQNAPFIIDKVNQMEETFDETSCQMKAGLNKQILDQANFRGYKGFRDLFQIGPKQLQNISPPNVIQKIWAELSNMMKLKNEITFEQFFHLDTNPIYPNEEFPIYSKVGRLYNVLNLVGYYQDKDIEKLNRFSGSLYDSNHVSNAIFCNCFMTSDYALVKKCAAIYEYLNIGTKILHFEPFSPNGRVETNRRQQRNKN